MRYQIRPLGQWPGPTTPWDARLSHHRFSARWLSTLVLLGRETELLGADLVVMQLDVRTGDIRRDGMLRADAKVGDVPPGDRRPGPAGPAGR